MTAPIMVAITDHLVAAGFAVLRFNFRGVGASAGDHGHGQGELADIDAAVAAAETSHPALPQRIAGWSFGAATALSWQAARGDVRPYAGIAPPVDSVRAPALPVPTELGTARRTFVIGDRDQFTAVDDLERYAEAIGAAVAVIKGSDHFFFFREERVATILADALG
jgi:alpha/beta superfamily hydrolase